MHWLFIPSYWREYERRNQGHKIKMALARVAKRLVSFFPLFHSFLHFTFFHSTFFSSHYHKYSQYNLIFPLAIFITPSHSLCLSPSRLFAFVGSHPPPPPTASGCSRTPGRWPPRGGAPCSPSACTASSSSGRTSSCSTSSWNGEMWKFLLE